jgi:hypothetical protein
MKSSIFLAVVFASLQAFTVSGPAQSPAPIVVQAASQIPTTAAPPAAAQTTSAADSASMTAMIKMLQDMKAKNADTLSKQEATLQQLDELQQAAQQLKIFTKRG